MRETKLASGQPGDSAKICENEGRGRDTGAVSVAANPPLLAFSQPTQMFTHGVETKTFRPTNTGGPITG